MTYGRFPALPKRAVRAHPNLVHMPAAKQALIGIILGASPPQVCACSHSSGPRGTRS